MKYNSYISWLIFFVLIIILGLVLGIYFDVGTKDRTILGLILAALWLGFDAYFIRRAKRREK